MVDGPSLSWIGTAIGVISLVVTGLGYVVRLLWSEITKLREWRHKVGDDPALTVFQLYGLQQKQIDRLERKVFNGSLKE